MRRTDEGYRFPYRLCRSGQDHRPPQADLCGGETSAPLYRLSGSPPGRRDLGRISYMIFIFPGRRSPADFRYPSACRRLPGPFLPVPTQFDKRQLLDLLSPTMGRVKIAATNAH
jgi:hypothetical protein